MHSALLLTATVTPGDVIFCDRRDETVRLGDYLHAFRFWLGESHVSRIVFVENSGFNLAPFTEMMTRYRRDDPKVELISFVKPKFDAGLGKSYGEAKIIEHALAHSELLRDDPFVVKATGRYYATNFFKVWPMVVQSKLPDVMASFYVYPVECDSRYFGASVTFLRDYFLPQTERINDAEGFYFEHALAAAVVTATEDGKQYRPWPGGGLLVDGVQASTNTTYEYSRLKRTLYRVVASLRNGVPLRLKLEAPMCKTCSREQYVSFLPLFT